MDTQMLRLCAPLTRIVCFSVIVFGGPCPSSALAENPDAASYLRPSELMKIAEDSQLTYTIRNLDELEDVGVEGISDSFWPLKASGPDYPKIIVAPDGKRELVEYDFGEECLTALVEAEPIFDAKRYDEALIFYLQAAQEHPECYLAFSHVADCHYFEGRNSEALAWYELAVQLNPADFRSHYYKANTLFNLGRLEDARRAYVTALALRPHRESVVKVVEMREDALNVSVSDRPFSPRAFARRETGGISVYVDAAAPQWLTYGLCKGVWIGEVEHRVARLGSRDHVWSSTEESQCLKSTLEGYFAMRNAGLAERDPQLERIHEIARSGLLDAFVVYEIAYRLHPHATLLLPEVMFDEVVEYIESFVVRDLVDDPSGMTE